MLTERAAESCEWIKRQKGHGWKFCQTHDTYHVNLWWVELTFLLEVQKEAGTINLRLFRCRAIPSSQRSPVAD